MVREDTSIGWMSDTLGSSRGLEHSLVPPGKQSLDPGSRRRRSFLFEVVDQKIVKPYETEIIMRVSPAGGICEVECQLQVSLV